MLKTLFDDQKIDEVTAAVPAALVRQHWDLGAAPDEYAAAIGFIEAADETYDSDLAERLEQKVQDWVSKEVASAVVSTYGGIELELGWRGIVIKSELFANLTDWKGGTAEGAWAAFSWEDLFRSTVFATDMEDPAGATKDCNSAELARTAAKALRELAGKMDAAAAAIEAEIA